jgi:hypothetical protein
MFPCGKVSAASSVRKLGLDAMDSLRDGRLLLQMLLRHGAQFFGVIAEVSQETAPFFFAAFGCC